MFDLYNTFANLILFTPILLFVHYRGFEFFGNLYYSTKEKIQRLFLLKKQLNEKNIHISNIIKTILFTIYLVCKHSLLQKLNQSIEKIDKNTYEITYSIGSRLYKFRTKTQKGMSNILQVIDSDNNDVTEFIELYLGPYRDFHNIEYTPYSLDFKSLTFNFNDGESTTFTEHDKITL
jgi:hypothetical protein